MTGGETQRENGSLIGATEGVWASFPLPSGVALGELSFAWGVGGFQDVLSPHLSMSEGPTEPG